jgi:hypothetical protein
VEKSRKAGGNMPNQNNAKFKLENCRITRLNERPKVCFLTVMVMAGKFPDYHDVTLFQPPSFKLEEGLAVTIVGELQKDKPKERGGKWETRLIARQITKGDDSKAPRPKRSGERQEAPIDDDLEF